MQIAIDAHGKRFAADNAEKGLDYHCPLCNGPVILKQGNIVEAHFAHESKRCKDRWHYDMSEWHQRMQLRFPEDQREVVIHHNGETHRADILCGKQIIEFQHSPISAAEIQERNTFYRSAGYQIAWVFDLSEQYLNRQIAPDDRINGNGYSWIRPKSTLKVFPQPRKNDKDLVIYFYWSDYGGTEYFNRIIWSAHENSVPNFKRFLVSSYGFDHHGRNAPLTVTDFFETEADLLANHLAKIPFPHSLKCSGPRGRTRDQYVCPKTGVFGLKKYGEQACAYCKYCAAVQEIPLGFQAYCCYPNQVHSTDGAHPGYETCGVPKF